MTQLRDGTEVLIRPITPADAAGLVRFHDSLSKDSVRLRFFRVHPHLTERETERFTRVDHHDREALTVMVHDQIIAVGRYDRRNKCGDAEVAFVVADQWQGLGVATLLLGELADRARLVGIDRFTADTLAENRSMLDVFAHSGLPATKSIAYGVVSLTMTL